MAQYGFIVERKLAADELGSLNIDAVCATNVDGGNLVTLGTYDKGVYTVTLGTAGATLGNWMAYNPEEKYTVINGTPTKMYAGLSIDPRDFTNLAGRPFSIFKPVVEDLIGFTAPNITGAVPTVGQFLEPDADGKLVVASAQTADSTSFEVIAVEKQPWAQAGVGMEFVPLYVCRCVAN